MNWNSRSADLLDASGSDAANRLFSLIGGLVGKKNEKLPHVLREAKPFLVAREIGRETWHAPRDRPTEQYRFQLGPRGWTSFVYGLDNPARDALLPRYEQAATAIARGLKAGDWVSLGTTLLDASCKDQPSDDERHIQIVLCWQHDDRLCAIRDQKTDRSVVYRLKAEGFELVGEPHPAPLRRLNEHAKTPMMPIVSLESGARDLKVAEKAGRIEELRAEIMWRYATKLDDRLDGLLLEALDRLRELGAVVGIAHARSRFNDAGNDDNWMAVRVDNFAWENGIYFTSNANSLRGAPRAVHEAVGILQHLVACGMERAFVDAYGYPATGGEVMGVFIESGKCVFACCNPNLSSGPTYRIDPRSGYTALDGFTRRFDDNFNTRFRAGGSVPKEIILESVSIDDLLKRIDSGSELDGDAPPHDLDVPWRLYLPSDPEA